MSEKTKKTVEQAGPGLPAIVHVDPVVRSSEEFRVSAMGEETKASWKAVCVDGDITPEHMRRIFSSIFGSDVVDAILK